MVRCQSFADKILFPTGKNKHIVLQTEFNKLDRIQSTTMISLRVSMFHQKSLIRICAESAGNAIHSIQSPPQYVPPRKNYTQQGK